VPEASDQPNFARRLRDFPAYQGPGGELCWFQRQAFPFWNGLALLVHDRFPSKTAIAPYNDPNPFSETLARWSAGTRSISDSQFRY
jgi:hypothetical protein